MRIRKLELHGFKSFPDRTIVEFGHGICCVVGPNGCGKSNIMDAIRWCIGEQSAKSLRGSEMMDVIFAGSQKRAPVGFAEVTIVFTADDGEPFPGEYARFNELSVGRRLHRSGASEYFINRERCRRKDVVDLFLDTGIGNNLYSFIEQGSIGKIVQASPEERRGMIEEAAGIAKYRARRHEAQQRLEKTATQLDRAADVEEELRTRLIGVEKQVFKAAKYRRLRARVKQGEILLGLARYADLAADRGALSEAVRVGHLDAERSTHALEAHDEKAEARREESLMQEAVVASHRDDAAEHDARHRELEGALGFHERRRDELIDELNRVTTEHTRAVTVRDAAREEIQTAIADVESLIASVAVAERDRTAREEALTTAQQRRRQAQQTLREMERLAAAAEVRASEARSRLEDLIRRTNAADQAVQRNRTEQTSLTESTSALESDLGAAKAEALQAEADAAEARAQSETSRAVAKEANESLQAIRDAARGAQQTVQRIEQQAAQQAKHGAQALVQLDKRARTSEREQRRSAEDAIRKAERSARDAVAQATRASDTAIQRAETSRKEAIRKAESERHSTIRAAQAQARESEQGLQSEWRTRLATLQSELADARKAAEALADEQRTVMVRDARTARDRAQLDLREAESDFTAAQQSANQSKATLAGLSAQFESLVQRIALEQQRAVGSDDIAALLRDHVRLGDLPNPPEWAATVLGRRLGLPVVNDIDTVLSARERLGDGTASMLWGDTSDFSWDATTAGVHRAASLKEALAHHKATGGAAVCTQTGDRVDVDGVVSLGVDDGGASVVLALQEERSQVQSRLDEVTASVEASAVTLAALAQRVASAQAALSRAEEALEQVADDADRAWREAMDAVRAQAEQRTATAHAERDDAVKRAREAGASDIAAATEQADATLAAAREATQGWVAQARSGREETIDAERTRGQKAILDLRAALESDLDTLRKGIDAERTALESGQERDASALSQQRSEAREALKAAQERLQSVEQRARQAERTRAQADARRSEAEMVVVRATARAERIESQLRETTTRISNLDLSLSRLQAALLEVTAERDAAQQLVTDAESGASAPREAVEAAQDQVTTLEEQEERLRKVVTVADIEIASLKERADGRRSARETAEKRQHEATEDIARLAEQQQGVVASQQSNRDELQAAKAELEEVALVRAEAWDALQGQREKLDAMREELKELEVKGRQLTQERDRIRHKLSADELRSHEVQMEIEALEKRIDERYLLSLPGLLDRMDATGRVEIAPDPDVQAPFEVAGRALDGVPPFTIRPDTLDDYARIEAMVEEVEANRRKLKNLGEVNLAALEEYEEVKTRHDDLAAQRDDLEQAVGAIRASIAKMNKHCRERFRETFHRVNENFTVAYPRLVGGGSAKLVLTDEEDMLTTGVEVMVQPPGKRVQNLTLLSGGEKAMCALAMIMSLFQVKPSPFCLLDEVDAPLDEANGARFNEMLREMSSLAQFIVITHNRKTMEVGNTLYGITMGQPGVSRLVSVQMPA